MSSEGDSTYTVTDGRIVSYKLSWNFLFRKRTSKSGTPQTSVERDPKESEFRFPEPLPPQVAQPIVPSTSQGTEDVVQKPRNISLRGLDSISEGGRRIIPGPVPPTVLEVKSSVGVRGYISIACFLDSCVSVAVKWAW